MFIGERSASSRATEANGAVVERGIAEEERVSDAEVGDAGSAESGAVSIPWAAEANAGRCA